MKTEEIEKVEELAATIPNVVDAARAQWDQQQRAQNRMLEAQHRRFCVEQAAKAVAVGGYDVDDIVRLAAGFHDFISGKTLIPKPKRGQNATSVNED